MTFRDRNGDAASGPHSGLWEEDGRHREQEGSPLMNTAGPKGACNGFGWLSPAGATCARGAPAGWFLQAEIG